MEFKYRILNFDFNVPNLKLKVNFEIEAKILCNGVKVKLSFQHFLISFYCAMCTRTKDEKGNIIAHFFAEKRCPPNEKFQK